MQSLVVDINLPREEYLRIYHTYIRNVKTTARNGQTVLFPVGVLKPFVTTLGVQGTFRLSFTEDKKFSGIEQM
jgi:hypothetical protein